MPMKRGKLRVKGHSETAELKEEIQRLVREIVILRDGGCILRKARKCNGTADADAVLQADHLITRANSATFADTRLIVCLCRSCHGGFKQWHKEEYDVLVKMILPHDRVELWEMCEEDRHMHLTKKMDWKLEILSLQKELTDIEKVLKIGKLDL